MTIKMTQLMSHIIFWATWCAPYCIGYQVFKHKETYKDKPFKIGFSELGADS
jgi:hypothetical protein